MAQGDQADMLGRLRATLPQRWFGDDAPVLGGVLSGIASALSGVYALLGYTRQQTRLATATEDGIDLVAMDYLGDRIQRAEGEGDDAFRGRVRREMLRPRGTRAALIQALTDLTGEAPDVIEPARPQDTGAWDTGVMAWDTAGALGDTCLSYQAFVTAYRPLGGSIAGVDGWDGALGGWDAGAIELVSDDMAAAHVSDADIAAAVAAVIPAASVAWLRITSRTAATPLLDESFTLDVSTLA